MRQILRLGSTLRFPGRRAPLWLLPLALMVFSLACQSGSYPIDFFPEMHYQTSVKFQEPPRVQPPSGSVPRTGGEVSYDFGAAAGLVNPLAKNEANLTRAKKLYAVNCAMCHGSEGKGGATAVGKDGAPGVGKRFADYNAPMPVDFSASRTKGQSDGTLFWIITNGLGNMPSWKNLLTEEQRWLLVQYVQSVR